MISGHGNARLDLIKTDFFQNQGIELYLKREDLLHPQISGNKWRKLFYNLKEAKRAGFRKLLTFGGAFSNHVYAAAAAGKEYGFETIGVIRGEEKVPLNNTLNFAKEQGMHLHFVTRGEYCSMTRNNLIGNLKAKFGSFYLIPEGGTNGLAVKGCIEILRDIDVPFDYICTPCGTGGTLAGLVAGLAGKRYAIGFSALKGGEFLNREVTGLVKGTENHYFKDFKIITDYHFGGYAKIDAELIDFIRYFKRQLGIQLDPIYTGKMMFGIFEMIKSGNFPARSKIIALHTGGLQGIAGMEKRYKVSLT